MDINTLVYELSSGVRLPNPKFCPQPIAKLLKQCFQGDPDDRPDFMKIMDEVKKADDTLRKHVLSIAKSSYFLPIDVMKNNKMEVRYLKMKEENEKQQGIINSAEMQDHFVIADENTPVLTYASLEMAAQSKPVKEPCLNSQVECQGELKTRIGSFSVLEKLGNNDEQHTITQMIETIAKHKQK